MEIIPAVGNAEGLGTELLVLGIFCDGPLTGSARAVNDRCAGKLSAMLRQIDLGETVGAVCMIGPLPGVAAKHLLLVGLGQAETYSEPAYRRALAAVAQALDDSPAAEVVVTLAENEIPRRSLGWRMQQAGRFLADSRCGFGFSDGAVRQEKRSIMLLVPQALTSELVRALQQGVAIGEGVSFAKSLVELPPDLCTPAFIERTVEQMASQFGFRVQVLGPRDFEEHGLAAFLASERAATGSCKLMALRSDRRMAAGRPIVLIGNGMAAREAPSGQTLRMDRAPLHDICGIASVLGVMRTVERLALALNVVCLIVATQDGAAGGPRWHSAMSEGSWRRRALEASLLADVLGYAARFSPSCVIDVAALTRACVVALGGHASCLFANDEALASELVTCGGTSGDRVWQLPLWDDDPLPSASDAAARAEGPPAATEIASDLARFASAYPWAHLEIAGTASAAGQMRNATGRPVPLLAEFLIGRAQKAPGQAAFPHRSKKELHS